MKEYNRINHEYIVLFFHKTPSIWVWRKLLTLPPEYPSLKPDLQEVILCLDPRTYGYAA